MSEQHEMTEEHGMAEEHEMAVEHAAYATESKDEGVSEGTIVDARLRAVLGEHVPIGVEGIGLVEEI